MASVPMGGFMSPQVRRAALGQRANNTDAKTNKPTNVSVDGPTVQSPLATIPPLKQPAPVALKSSTAEDPSAKLRLLTPTSSAIASKPIASLSSTPAVPETKEVVGLLANLKPYFTPPTARKQLSLKFGRSVSTGQPGSSTAMSIAEDDHQFHFNFPKGEIDLTGTTGINDSAGRGRFGRFTTDY